MKAEEFFRHYPQRKSDSNKFDNGRVLIVAGSYGMAGACAFNVIGASAVGSSYIHVVLPESIYPIVAAQALSAVYHPDRMDDEDFLKNSTLYQKVDAVAVGSGLDHHNWAQAYLRDLLQLSEVPVVVDAYALRLLAEKKELLKGEGVRILTPHLGEFARLTGLETKEIAKDRENIAVNYARDNNVILVLKGPQTLVISPAGEIYRNDSGNEALAQAGSGDVLTGMIAGLCALYEDTYQAAIDGVWLHGHLADAYTADHSRVIFDLSRYTEYAEAFFSAYGR